MCEFLSGDIKKEFTISFWVLISECKDTSEYTIFDTYDSGDGDNLRIQVVYKKRELSNNLQLKYRLLWSDSITTTEHYYEKTSTLHTDLLIGNWYHLTLGINFKDYTAIDSNSFKFYKNGVELTIDNELMSVTTGPITLDDISRTYSTVTTNITINAYNRRYVIGNISASYFDIFIWNRLLTSGIQNIMYYGKSIKNNSSVTSPNLTFPYNGLICEEFVKTGPIGKYNKDTTLQDVYGSDLIPNNVSLYDESTGVNYLIPFVSDKSTILFDNNNNLYLSGYRALI